MDDLSKEMEDAVSSFICSVIQAAVTTYEQELMETRKHIEVKKDFSTEEDVLSVQRTNIPERTCCHFYCDNIMRKSTEKVALYLQNYHEDIEQRSINEQAYEKKNKARTFFRTLYRILTRKEKKNLDNPMPKVKKEKQKWTWNCRFFCKGDKEEIIPSISDSQLGSTNDELDWNTSDIDETPRPKLEPFFQRKEATVGNKTRQIGKGENVPLRGFLKHFTCCFGRKCKK